MSETYAEKFDKSAGSNKNNTGKNEISILSYEFYVCILKE